MNQERMIRLVAVLAGAAVLFVLEQQFGAELYVAIPGGIVAYTVTRVGLGLVFEKRTQAK